MLKKLYNEILLPLSHVSCFAPLCLPNTQCTTDIHIYYCLLILLEFSVSWYNHIGRNILIFSPRLVCLPSFLLSFLSSLNLPLHTPCPLPPPPSSSSYKNGTISMCTILYFFHSVYLGHLSLEANSFFMQLHDMESQLF